MAIGQSNLNANIILQGLATTDPEMMSNINQKSAENAAMLSNAQMQRQLIPSETQKNLAQAQLLQGQASLYQNLTSSKPTKAAPTGVGASPTAPGGSATTAPPPFLANSSGDNPQPSGWDPSNPYGILQQNWAPTQPIPASAPAAATPVQIQPTQPASEASS